MSEQTTNLHPVPDDPCESCQLEPATMTVPGNQPRWWDFPGPDPVPDYDIRICARCGALLAPTAEHIPVH